MSPYVRQMWNKASDILLFANSDSVIVTLKGCCWNSDLSVMRKGEERRMTCSEKQLTSELSPTSRIVTAEASVIVTSARSSLPLTQDKGKWKPWIVTLAKVQKPVTKRAFSNSVAPGTNVALESAKLPDEVIFIAAAIEIVCAFPRIVRLVEISLCRESVCCHEGRSTSRREGDWLADARAVSRLGNVASSLESCVATV